MKLIEIYAALPTTNSEIERGFSCMKRIKTALRNKLSVGRLQDLMMIALNGEDVKLWRPDESFNHWNSTHDVRNFRKFDFIFNLLAFSF